MFEKKSLMLEHKPLVDIRQTLSKFSTDFLRRLQARSAFNQNDGLYTPSLFDNSQSYLEFVLARKEAYYKAIGRFRHDAEFPITDVSGVECPFPATLRDPVSEVRCDLSGLVPLYTSLVPTICRPGENPGREGQITDLDVEALMSLSRRVNSGRYVAQDKYETNPAVQAALAADTPENRLALRSALVFPEQEKKVLDSIEDFVSNSPDITLDQNVARSIFRQVIDFTVNLEIEYLFNAYAKRKV